VARQRGGGDFLAAPTQRIHCRRDEFRRAEPCPGDSEILGVRTVVYPVERHGESAAHGARPARCVAPQRVARVEGVLVVEVLEQVDARKRRGGPAFGESGPAGLAVGLRPIGPQHVFGVHEVVDELAAGDRERSVLGGVRDRGVVFGQGIDVVRLELAAHAREHAVGIMQVDDARGRRAGRFGHSLRRGRRRAGDHRAGQRQAGGEQQAQPRSGASDWQHGQFPWSEVPASRQDAASVNRGRRGRG
jgi:hypothetical protein